MLPVIAVHPDPLRVNVYMDVDHAGLMGLEGTTNVIHARPAPGQSVDAVKRETFELPGVASVQGVAANAAIVRELMEQWVGILRVAEVVVLGLALLIAFNTASISADERAREYATMFAYGVPVRTVMRVAVIESAVVGALAAVVGLGGGYLMLRWIVDIVWPRVQPDLGVLLGVRAGEPGSRSWAWRARGGRGAAADRSQAAQDGRAVHPPRNGVAQPAVWASAMAPSTPDRAPSAGVTMYSSMASDTSGARTKPASSSRTLAPNARRQRGPDHDSAAHDDPSRRQRAHQVHDAGREIPRLELPRRMVVRQQLGPPDPIAARSPARTPAPRGSPRGSGRRRRSRRRPCRAERACGPSRGGRARARDLPPAIAPPPMPVPTVTYTNVVDAHRGAPQVLRQRGCVDVRVQRDRHAERVRHSADQVDTLPRQLGRRRHASVSR